MSDLSKHIAHLEEMVKDLEIAVEVEDRVMKAYQEVVFMPKSKDTMMERRKGIYLDAKLNRRRFEADALSIRTVLNALEDRL